MIEKITGAWLIFCIGNLLADIGIVLFAVTVYKIGKASSKFSSELIEYSARMSEYSAELYSSPSMPEVELAPEERPQRGPEYEPYMGPIAPTIPSPPQELSQWEAWQKRFLIVFVIGIVIQIFALSYSAS